MTSREQARLNMYQTIVNVCDAHPKAIESHPAFAQHFQVFKQITEHITELSNQETADENTTRSQRKRLRASLIADALSFGGAIYTFAIESRNNGLRDSFDYSESRFLRFKDADLVVELRTIYDTVAKYVLQLPNYGISLAMISEFQQGINYFEQLLSSGDKSKRGNAALTTEIKKHLATANEILQFRMDKLGQLFRKTHPSFFKQYDEGRLILDERTTRTLFSGRVQDINGNGLGGIKIRIFNPSFETTLESDGSGNFSAPTKMGIYEVSVSEEGFSPFSARDYRMVQGRNNQLDITLSAE